MRWLVGAAMLLVVAMALDLGLLAYAMYALVGVIVLSRKLADVWSRELSATREMSRDQVKIGESVAVVTVLENKSWLPVPWLLLEDLLPRRAVIFDPPNLKVTGRRLQLVSFPGRARKTVLYQLTCNRRGYYQIGPLVAETGDVFGLYRRYRVLTEPHFLLALPEVIPLAGFDVASRRPLGEVRMTHRLFEDPTRIAGVRGYQAGDPLNRIHWGATARTATLQSKIYEPSTIAGVTILLDFHEQSYDPKHEPVRSELAVTAAASIAAAVCEMGQQVGLATNGRDAADRIRTEGWRHEQLSSRKLAQGSGMRERSDRLRPVAVPTGHSNTQLQQILRTLARVEKTDGLSFAQLVVEVSSRLPRSATVIAMLSNVTPASAIALGSLRRRGYAVTAIVNAFEEFDYARMAGPLMAEQVDVRQLRDRAAIPQVCLKCLLR
ncbi:DUF58 domain-containing protein [Lacipirellula limnantheis]|uniref:DUF58 domain-containing protein n=1 Tax=Lacipirellula limnantheis TaxID=2528024 RepID=A0A517TTL7_9BACT|nr:DUF58 domain-containing protein [Lacipirellula limnantheis]QDT71717.1 hypothetical protein I41_08770 [Lacipirellula limnantheis]